MMRTCNIHTRLSLRGDAVYDDNAHHYYTIKGRVLFIQLTNIEFTVTMHVIDSYIQRDYQPVLSTVTSLVSIRSI